MGDIPTRCFVNIILPAYPVAVFALLHPRLPDNDGFSGFLPIFVAILVFAAGSPTTERGLVRFRDSASTR
ncbi:hypothetical protein [Paeniglutamicibacter psychrophenolicus]|uniref:hypothetical protein n=1 Tax=Paeniglutamicibacter psychrophenolicus TaxID=257454 RepID=UPI002788DF60|nr:hypothetical protein [Paeniglutamicibacter psychrophenolicus]MDQ0092152.1 hypothetical protein [Paeniglutamicibacter psychrophenolicus]